MICIFGSMKKKFSQQNYIEINHDVNIIAFLEFHFPRRISDRFTISIACVKSALDF